MPESNSESAGPTTILRPYASSDIPKEILDPAPSAAAPDVVVTTTALVVHGSKKIPTMGLPALIYKWNVRRHGEENAAIPNLSKKEAELNKQRAAEDAARAEAEAEAARVALAAKQKAQALLDADQRIIDLSDQVPSLCVSFSGSKGSSSTTTVAISTVSEHSEITRSLVFYGDFNPASGNGAMRLGKEFKDTLTISGLSRIVDSITQPRQLLPLLRPTKNGVRVLSANDPTEVKYMQTIFGTTARKMLTVLRDHCDYLYLDTPNNLTEKGAIEVFEASDVLVFTANAQVPASLYQLGLSMQTVRELGYADKVANGLVVISNLAAGEDLQKYRKYLNRVDLQDNVVQNYHFDGPFMGIPHDPTLQLDRILDRSHLADDTSLAIKSIDAVILEQGLKALKPAVPAKHTSSTPTQQP